MTTELAYGSHTVVSNPVISYTDCSNKEKSNNLASPNYRNIDARGAWLVLSYVVKIVER